MVSSSAIDYACNLFLPCYGLRFHTSYSVYLPFLLAYMIVKLVWGIRMVPWLITLCPSISISGSLSLPALYSVISYFHV